MREPAAYAFDLWLFTALLFIRVIGQIVVVLWGPRWLPPMSQWQSGLLPYSLLLAGQIVVMTIMVWIAVNFTSGEGPFVHPRPEMGRFVVWFSYAYFAAMVVALHRPDEATTRSAVVRRRDPDRLPLCRRSLPLDVRHLSRRLTARLSRRFTSSDDARDAPRVECDIPEATPHVIVVPDEVEVRLILAHHPVVS